MQKIFSRGLAPLITAVLMAAVGCTQPAQPPTSLGDTTTTNATTSTKEPPASPSPPTTVSEDELRTANLEAIVSAHTAFMTNAWDVDELSNGYDATLEALKPHVTQGYLAWYSDVVAERQSKEEFFIGPAYQSTITGVSYDGGGVATVFDCSAQLGELVDAAGNSTNRGDGSHTLRQTELHLVNNRWLVDQLWSQFEGEEISCDPADAGDFGDSGGAGTSDELFTTTSS